MSIWYSSSFPYSLLFYYSSFSRLRFTCRVGRQFREPLVGLLLGFRLQDAVALLDQADEQLLLPAHVLHIVVRELPPLGFEGALHLMPLPLDLLPIHWFSFFDAFASPS